MNKFLKRTKGLVTSRGFSSGTLTAILLAAVIAFNAVIYALTSLLGLYIYLPEKNDFSISGNTDGLFADAELLGKEVNIIFCLAKSDIEKQDTGSYVLKTAEEFEKRYSFINLKFYNIITRVDQDGNPVSLDKYKKDMYGEDNVINQGSVIFECGDNYRVVTDLYSSAGYADFFSLNSEGLADAYIGEEIMGSMISWVLNNEHKKVYITQNHGETADISFGTMLSCAGYTVGFVNLSKEPVPSDAELLIISNPTSDFEIADEGASVRAERDRLVDYLEGGGQLYVSVDPFAKHLPVLEGVLKEYGIELAGGVGDGGKYVRDIVKENTDAITPDGLTFVAECAGGDGHISDTIAGRIQQYGTGRVLLSQSGRLILTESARPLLISSANSVTYRLDEIYDDGGSYAVAAYSEKNAKDGKVSRVFVSTGIYLTASNAMNNSGYSNKDFIYALFSEFYGAPTAIYGANTINYNDDVLNNFTMGKARAFTAVLLAIPVCLTVVGTVVIIKRKNR